MNYLSNADKRMTYEVRTATRGPLSNEYGWCRENVGDFAVDWYVLGYQFSFKEEKYAVLFALRWA